MLSQQNFLFQRQILLLINCPHKLFLHFLSFQETFIEKCSSKFKINTFVTEGKKWFLKWSRKEQNLTPDIFSYKCRIEIKLSTHTNLNISQNFWMLYAQLNSFTVFMTTLLAKTVTEGIGYGHYTPSMTASKVVLRTSGK